MVNGVGGSSYAIKFMYIFKRPITELPNDLINKFQDVLNRTPIYLRDALRKVENFFSSIELHNYKIYLYRI